MKDFMGFLKNTSFKIFFIFCIFYTIPDPLMKLWAFDHHSFHSLIKKENLWIHMAFRIFQLIFFRFILFTLSFCFCFQKVRNFYVHATSRLDRSCSLEFRQNKIKKHNKQNKKRKNLWKQSQTSWNQSQILWNYAGYVAKKMKMFSIFTNIQIY